MKINVWTLSTCVPGKAYPCLPEVFATREAAEAAAEKRLKQEWAIASPCDDEGDPLPYPGDWREANDHLSSENAKRGQWELTSHQIEIPTPNLAVIVEGGCVVNVVTSAEEMIGAPYTVIDYDTEGADPSDLHPIKQANESTALAFFGSGEIDFAPLEYLSIKTD